MCPRSQPVAQRIHAVTTQIERLRGLLSSKSRNSFKSDVHYRSWLEKTTDLLAEWESELSALSDPGEYDQLPPAVVAEELGTTTARVRLLIKGGEILASGKPTHEYVSREEVEAACEMGLKELLRRLEQGAAEVFEKSVAYLHQGHMPLAERTCQRLIARESIAGAFALPYETALYLAKGELYEVDVRLGFIRRAVGTEKARLIHNLCRLLHGMSIQDEAAKAIAERLLHDEEASGVDGRKIAGSKLDEQQRLAMFITTVVFGELDRRWKRHLPPSRREELQEIIQDAVYSSLYAHESYDRLASSREFVNAVRVLMPRYFKAAKLIGDLVREQDKNEGSTIGG